MPVQFQKCRIVQVNDVHLDVRSPSSRRDDYFQALKNKLEDVLEFCSEWNADAVVFTGDLFHRKESSAVPPILLSWTISYFNRLATLCDVFLIPGNHDISRRPDVSNQPIGVIYTACPSVILPGESCLSQYQCDPSIIVNFIGRSFYYDLDKDRRGYQIKRNPYAAWNILIVHGMLIPDGRTYFSEFTTPADISSFDGDLILCGHYHDNDFGHFKGVNPETGRVFHCVNHGSISRGSIAGFNLFRDPVFTAIELGCNGEINISIKVPKSARLASDIFKVEEKEKAEESKREMEEVVSFLQNLTSTTSVADFASLFQEALKGLSPEVASMAQRFFAKARELNGGSID